MVQACGKKGGGVEEKLVKRVYRTNFEGKRRRGRPQRSWGDEVKELLMGKGLRERERMVLARDGEAWDRIVFRSK